MATWMGEIAAQATSIKHAAQLIKEAVKTRAPHLEEQTGEWKTQVQLAAGAVWSNARKERRLWAKDDAGDDQLYDQLGCGRPSFQ